MPTPVRRRRRPVPEASPAAVSLPELNNVLNSLRVVDVPIDDLREPLRNVRCYTKRQISALKASVSRWGIVRPPLVAPNGTIIAGVAIWIAAKELDLKTIPVVYADTLSAEEIRLYRIADNKLSTLGEYNEDALRLEFLELGELSLNLDLNLNLEDTGFTTCEIDQVTLKEKREEPEPDDDDQAPPVNPVSRLGDIWLIGNHKVLCGNSLEEEGYQALLGDERAQMVVCDGPYGVKIKGNVSSRKDAKEFAYASGEMAPSEFVTFERTVFGHLIKYSVNGSIHYHFISWHFACELLMAGREEYDELKNILVWVKSNASRGFYRSQHEFCCVFKNGTAPHICTFGLVEGARWRSNVLTGYPGCNSFGPNRDQDLADHPTVKNTSLIADLIRDCSRLGGLILDPFGGAGTTLLASEHTGRRARLIEIDPGYVDVTVRRARERCGLEAVLAATGQTFEEVALERLGAEALAALDPEDADPDDAGLDDDDMAWFRAGAADLARDGKATND